MCARAIQCRERSGAGERRLRQSEGGGETGERERGDCKAEVPPRLPSVRVRPPLRSPPQSTRRRHVDLGSVKRGDAKPERTVAGIKKQTTQ